MSTEVHTINGREITLELQGNQWQASTPVGGKHTARANGPDRDTAVIMLEALLGDERHATEVYKQETFMGFPVDPKYRWMFTCSCGDQDAFYDKADAVNEAHRHSTFNETVVVV